MIFNQCIFVISADIDEKRFVLFEHTINRVSSCYVRLLQLEYYFFFYFSFLLSICFLFLLELSIFKQMKAQYLNFERLNILRRTSVCLKSGVPRLGSSKTLNF